MPREALVGVVKIIWTIAVYVFAVIGFVLVVGYFATRFGLTNTKGIIDLQREAFLGNATTTAAANLAPTYPNGTPWQNTEEWQVLSAAATKDAPAINQAAAASGVPTRLIVANLVVEQLRLFFTERAFYKQFFAPLKILGAQTQFSWGVMGMKEATAVQVENNLKNPASPLYPGSQYEHLLDFPAGGNASSTLDARFARMTDQHNHYYSYLYAGLALKELEAQWQDSQSTTVQTCSRLSITSALSTQCQTRTPRSAAQQSSSMTSPTALAASPNSSTNQTSLPTSSQDNKLS
jgi:hypothetical protein